jgi:hypothetical protein
MHALRNALLAATLLVSAIALALPATKSESDSVDDATVTLTVLDKTILGDNKSFCQVRLKDVGSEVSFKAGDKVFVWVYENDTVGDDAIWETDFTVSSAEVTANKVDRTMDCSGPFGDDVGDEAEYYAKARVEKDECGFWCTLDRPSTSNITVPEVDDDGREEDDTTGTAKPLGLGTVSESIARDQDWHSFQVVSLSDVVFDALHDPDTGRLDAILLDAAGAQLAIGVDHADRTQVSATFLLAGTYHLRVSPRSSANFNFYDMDLGLETVPVECTPGVPGTEACGLCGERARPCSEYGQWGDWGACGGEGVCTPGTQETDPCGLCGQSQRVCTPACQWDVGACAGEGECEPDAVEDQTCEGIGTQSRSCGVDCMWGAFGDCEGIECFGGQTEPCYTGPVDTEGTGACLGGTRTCSNGTWGDCEDEVVPVPELCDVAGDQDCDGEGDDSDTDCEGASDLGEACNSDDDCKFWLSCLVEPDYPQFEAGYCSVEECYSDYACGDDGLCSLLFDAWLCLRVCDLTSDCRPGYVCADFGAVDACIPRCWSDDDCPDPDLGSCDQETGYCIPTPQPDPDPEPQPEVVEETTQPEPQPEVVDDTTQPEPQPEVIDPGEDTATPGEDSAGPGEDTATPGEDSSDPGKDSTGAPNVDITTDWTIGTDGEGGGALPAAGSSGCVMQPRPSAAGWLMLLALASCWFMRRRGSIQ